MERLTKTFEENGKLFACLPECEHSCVYGWDEDNSGCRCSKFTKILTRLAAYEDTGLEPQEIERIRDAYGRGLSLRTESAERLQLIREIPTARLRELVEADRDGRCVAKSSWKVVCTADGQFEAVCENCGASGSLAATSCLHCPGCGAKMYGLVEVQRDESLQQECSETENQPKENREKEG